MPRTGNIPHSPLLPAFFRRQGKCHGGLLIQRAIVLMVLAGLACSDTSVVAGQKPRQNAKSRCGLTQGDYSVYSALIAALGKPEDPEEAWQGKEMLIVTATATPTLVRSQWGDWGFRSNSKAAPARDTVADFEVKARTSCPVEDHFGDPQSYRLITDEEIKEIFAKNARGWEEFYKRHPKAAGFWGFSRPGYNATRDEAVLYVSHSCGGLCGTGHLYFLARQNEQWAVKNRLLLWIS